MSGASSTTRIFSLLTGLSSLLPHTRGFWQSHLEWFDERRVCIRVGRVGLGFIDIETVGPLVDGSYQLTRIIGLVAANDMLDVAPDNRLAVGVDQRGIRADHTRGVDHKAAADLAVMADS